MTQRSFFLFPKIANDLLLIAAGDKVIIMLHFIFHKAPFIVINIQKCLYAVELYISSFYDKITERWIYHCQLYLGPDTSSQNATFISCGGSILQWVKSKSFLFHNALEDFTVVCCLFKLVVTSFLLLQLHSTTPSHIHGETNRLKTCRKWI